MQEASKHLALGPDPDGLIFLTPVQLQKPSTEPKLTVP